MAWRASAAKQNQNKIDATFTPLSSVAVSSSLPLRSYPRQAFPRANSTLGYNAPIKSVSPVRGYRKTRFRFLPIETGAKRSIF